MEYYSIEFAYPAARRGIGSVAEGVHIMLAVDEDAESKQLDRVERLVSNAARTADLRLHHQYSWPDGSCLKWAITETREEFEAKFSRLKRILASPWMSVRVHPHATAVEDPAAANGNSCHLTLVDRIAGNPMLHFDDSYQPLEPLTSWGGMQPADWVRYREHHAFEDGFKVAFGHYTNFWHGGHQGYVPSERAQELAGVGYHLGLLFKLLHY